MDFHVERLNRFNDCLKLNHLDAAIIQLPENVLFLSGYWPMIGMSVLLFPQGEVPICIIPDCYRREAEDCLWNIERVYYSYGTLKSPDPVTELIRIISKITEEKKLKRIGLELSSNIAAVSWNSAEFLQPLDFIQKIINEEAGIYEVKDVSHLLDTQKSVKTSCEIDKIRIANVCSSIGLRAFYDNVRPGVSGCELVAEVEKAIMIESAGLGIKRARAFAQVAVGADETSVAYRPNEISTSRRLSEHDIALLELGVVADGYWADRSRTAISGSPTKDQFRTIEVLKSAQKEALHIIKPGTKFSEIDSAARSYISDAGYGDYFPHITGHGTGFSYHEPKIKVCPDCDVIVEEGMVFTIEPGIYIPDFGGMRIEDDVAVTRDGIEILGPFHNSLKG